MGTRTVPIDPQFRAVAGGEVQACAIPHCRCTDRGACSRRRLRKARNVVVLVPAGSEVWHSSKYVPEGLVEDDRGGVVDGEGEGGIGHACRRNGPMSTEKTVCESSADGGQFPTRKQVVDGGSSSYELAWSGVGQRGGGLRAGEPLRRTEKSRARSSVGEGRGRKREARED